MQRRKNLTRRWRIGSPHRHLAILASLAALLVVGVAVPPASAKKPVKPPDGGSVTAPDDGSSTPSDGGATTAPADGSTAPSDDGSTTAPYYGGGIICAADDWGCWEPPPPPPECAELTDAEAQLWTDYLVWASGGGDGWPNPEPSLTKEQIELYGTCFGWWF